VTAKRRDLWWLAGAWLVAAVLMTLLSLGTIAERQFPDPDDVMRLLQVRDWIGGQSWFDVTQHRLNPPDGVPMHWSRLVDIPIAAVILLLRPFAGAQGAETAALVAVPLITLGVAMLLVQRVGLKLMNAGPALAAAIATPLSLGGLKQMRPMRIDHHGWQIVMALAGLLAALDPKPRRSGAVTGAAMAVWMNISMEGLPFAAAFGVLFAWQWLADPGATERLRFYLGSLAVSSLLLFGLTHWPSTWAHQPHDVITLAHLAAFAMAAGTCAVAVRPQVAQLRTRVLSLASAGALSLAAAFAVDPHWLVGPFGSLDPIVRTFWYDRVDEGLPVWQVDWRESAIGLAQPLVGLIGAAFALCCTSGAQRRLWAIYAFVLFALTLGGLFVIRTETTASVLALPGTAFLCALALGRARNSSLMPARVVGTAAALCIMTPAYAVPISMTRVDQRLETAARAWGDCMMKSEVEKLRALPTGYIAAPLDITPAILVGTDHRALATGHHRNATGMRDAIRLFVFPAERAEEIAARRQFDYIVFCPGAPEAIRYANQGPRGLSAMLRAGKAPEWLERVPVRGLHGLQVWRVRKPIVEAQAEGSNPSVEKL
jgi:hypothetical protein